MIQQQNVWRPLTEPGFTASVCVRAAEMGLKKPRFFRFSKSLNFSSF